MANIWECYGHGAPGKAIVSAPSRATALQACFEWLGWRVGVAFQKPAQLTLWVNCGGSAERPVVYAADGEHFAALEQRMVDEHAESERTARDFQIAVTEAVYWEDKL